MAEYNTALKDRLIGISFVFTDVTQYRLAKSCRSPFFCNDQQPKKCNIPGLLQPELENTKRQRYPVIDSEARMGGRGTALHFLPRR
jgi:hypothetical protein